MIGIINYHRADNYGAVLQAYALQRMILKLGYECEIIDYKCAYIHRHYKLFHFNDLVQLTSDLVYFKDHIQKKSGFERFRKQYLKLSKHIYTRNDIYSSNQKYHVFITGSDQVFNYTNTGFDATYFLDFVDKKNYKCSYAASFGFSELPENYYESYKRLLTGYKYISFREQSGVQLYNRLMAGSEAAVVLDPTLAADNTIWNLCNSSAISHSPYILVYMLERSSETFEFIKFLKQKTGFKVIYIGSLVKHHRENLDATYLGGLSPDDFVNLFKNASYVVTNSFHGTAFSIIFKKLFWVSLLKNGKATNARFTNILSSLQLSDRIIPKQYDNTFFDAKIDFSKVDRHLQLFKEQAVDYLKKVCELDKKVEKI